MKILINSKANSKIFYAATQTTYLSRRQNKLKFVNY